VDIVLTSQIDISFWILAEIILGTREWIICKDLKNIFSIYQTLKKHYKHHVHYFFIVLFIFSYHFHFRSFYFLSLADIWMATSYLISLGIPELSNSNNKRLVNQKRLCPNRNVKVICKETSITTLLKTLLILKVSLLLRKRSIKSASDICHYLLFRLTY